jgi:hypothetical protein
LKVQAGSSLTGSSLKRPIRLLYHLRVAVIDLNEFLFGSERAVLAVVRPVLLDIQSGRCFYCRAPLTPAATHVDHFIAWARYPVDLGHNFVLADSRCNNQKRDGPPAERNAEFGTEITSELERRGVIAELASSNRVTRWAYSQTEGAGGLTWVRADEMVPLVAMWRDLIQPFCEM